MKPRLWLRLRFSSPFSHQASTISFEGTGMKEVREVEEPSSDDEEEEKADLSGKHTDEELFKLCGGRTAHK